MRYSYALAASILATAASGIWVSRACDHYELVEKRETIRNREGLSARNVQSLVNESVWQLRRSLAILTWTEAQTYFHGGFDLAAFSKNLLLEKKAEQDRKAHGEEERDHDHEHHDTMAPRLHSEEDERRIAWLHNHPALQETLLRPYVFLHTDEIGGGARRMMPFYWLTTQLDPNFVRAYVNGAYFLAFHFKLRDEAMKYVDQGLRFNPDDASLHAMKGHILFTIDKDFADAAKEFQRAVSLAHSESDDESEDYFTWFRYLGRSHLNVGNYEAAIATAYAAKQVDSLVVGFDAIITEATLALEGHPGGK